MNRFVNTVRGAQFRTGRAISYGARTSFRTGRAPAFVRGAPSRPAYLPQRARGFTADPVSRVPSFGRNALYCYLAGREARPVRTHSARTKFDTPKRRKNFVRGAHQLSYGARTTLATASRRLRRWIPRAPALHNTERFGRRTERVRQNRSAQRSRPLSLPRGARGAPRTVLRAPYGVARPVRKARARGCYSYVDFALRCSTVPENVFVVIESLKPKPARSRHLLQP